MPRQRKVKPTPAFLRETIYSGTHYQTSSWGVLWQVLSDPHHWDHDKVVDVISPLIEKGGTNEAAAEAARRFNHWFGDRPRTVKLDTHVPGEWDPDGYDLEIVPANIVPTTDAALENFLRSKPSWRRVKRCPECFRYFFDVTTRNHRIYDTPTCAHRAGSRRFRAAHRQE